MESQTTIENSPTDKLVTSPLSVPLTPLELQSLKEKTRQGSDEAFHLFKEMFAKDEGSDKK